MKVAKKKISVNANKLSKKSQKQILGGDSGETPIVVVVPTIDYGNLGGFAVSGRSSS